MDTVSFCLAAAAVYLSLGLVFAIPFVFIGVGQVDQTARKATFGFRVIIIPGSMLLWPILFRKWLQASKNRRYDHSPT